MSNNINVLDLILHASLPVQLVMLLLVLASISSWVIILRKKRVLDRAAKSADDFEERFWSGADMSVLFREISNQDGRGGLESIFEAGFREFARLRQKKNMDNRTQLEGAQRAMRTALSREIDGLEHNLEYLANVGSISPYVGLFGTVWGIYHALIAIGVSGQGTLDKVAGPVGEALIMTGLGLAVAIPAALAYNFFVRHTRNTMTELNGFAHDVFALLVIGIKRQADAGLPAKADGAVTPLTWARKQPAQAAH